MAKSDLFKGTEVVAFILFWGLGACNTSMQREHDPGSNAERVSALVGPKGGRLSLSRGDGTGAAIVIPPGALVSPVQITMRAARVPKDVPTRLTLAGPYIDFGPDGLTFAKPVAITLPTAGPASEVYQRSSGGGWGIVPDAHRTATREMVANIRHFSGYVPVQDKGPDGIPYSVKTSNPHDVCVPPGQKPYKELPHKYSAGNAGNIVLGIRQDFTAANDVFAKIFPEFGFASFDGAKRPNNRIGQFIENPDETPPIEDPEHPPLLGQPAEPEGWLHSSGYVHL